MSHTNDLHYILLRLEEHKAELKSILTKYRVNDYCIDELSHAIIELYDYVANRLTEQYNKESTYDTINI